MRPLKEIEYSFFGCLFDKPQERVLEAMSEGAKVDWFTEDRCKVMWAAVESLWKDGTFEHTDALQIVQEAKRLTRIPKGEFAGIDIDANFYSESLDYRKSASDIERSDIRGYAQILREGSIERRIKSAMKTSAEDFTRETSSENVGSSLANNIIRIIEDEAPVKEISVADLSESIIEDYKKAHEEFAVKKNYDYTVGIPLPWPDASRILNGLQVGLHLVAGRPSAGKTSYVLQCINYWCSRGYRVVFNCLDMAAKQILKRPLSTISGVAIDRCEEGYATEEELQKVVEANAVLNKWAKDGLFTVKCEYDVHQFKTWCAIRHAAGKLDIAVIDYAQQLRFRNSGNKSENERLTEVSAVLKSIAVELGMPVVALSQLSRDNVKDKNGVRPPTIADLRGSGSLEQDAFSVTLIYKDEQVMNYWNDNADTCAPRHLTPRSKDIALRYDNIKAIGAVWVNYAKNQNGRTGELPFVVYQNHYRWFVGDQFAVVAEAGKPKKLNKFLKITADWRFLQSPFRDIEKVGGKWTLIDDPKRPGKRIKDHPYVVYPDFWELKAEKICRDFGWGVPDYIAAGVNRIMNASLRQDPLPPMTDKTAKSIIEPSYVQEEPIAVPQPLPPSPSTAQQGSAEEESSDDPNGFPDNVSDTEDPDPTSTVDTDYSEQPTASYYSKDGSNVLEDNPF